MERLINFVAGYFQSDPLSIQSAFLKMTFVSSIMVVILAIVVDISSNQLYLIRYKVKQIFMN